MRIFAFATLGPLTVALALGPTAARAQAAPEHGAATQSGVDTSRLVRRYCVRCHGRRKPEGGLTLSGFDVAAADRHAAVAEKMIRKLRAGMMPPPRARRPSAEQAKALVEELEARVDAAAAADPNPGHRSFQRLNRAEYRASIKELLDLDVDASEYLPLDSKSDNFDNIADAQPLSATLLNAYLTAADEISRLAVGDPNAPVKSKTFTNSGFVSQWERVEGAPRGTRGGVSAMHNFPADGEYVFALAFEHGTTGGFVGSSSRDEQVDISIDGERVALLEVDQFMHVSDPNGANMWTEPIPVKAGPHRVTAAFMRRFDGPLEDPVSPYDWSLVSRSNGGSAMTVLAHIKDLVVKGPYRPTGVSETPSRRRIFSRRPTAPDEERICAEEIIRELATKAFRDKLSAADRSSLLAIYEGAAADGGFEVGIRHALQAILSSPKFVFRIEEPPADVEPGASYRISDPDLATRLSFFLWGSIPDDELLGLALKGELSDRLEQQARRMFADPRASALATRFAAQWLRLEDLEKVKPDRLAYPDFHEQLGDAMRTETVLFFENLVREDRDVFELLTADYTFVNGPLAKHYGIDGVSGGAFRRVALGDDNRRGVLGHGSFLTSTSHANRTSAVLRGKWVMEVLLGSPPPPPPPNVPELEETEAASEGRLLSARERLEMHRANPACTSCHRMIDPIGVALENFDVTGAWRLRDNLNPVDTDTEMFDGRKMSSPADLRNALLAYPDALARTFIENLMAYALGRRIEYYDMPTVRKIAREAKAHGNRISALVLGVVHSPAFRMSRAEPARTSGDERR